MTRPRSVIALAVCLVVAGCGEAKEQVTSTKAQATGAEAPAKSGGPKVGGYLVIPSSEPRHVNPVLQNAVDLVHPLVFEGLVGLDAKGELVPRLAERWERSPDEKTLTFHLRKNVVWHDGKPFTGGDVVFTFEKIRSERSPWAGYLAPVEAIEALDPHTVKVTLAQPFGPDVASFTFGVVPRHAFEGQEFATATANREPIGTGPFRFTRWTPGKSIILDANVQHWSGRPYADQIELVFEKQIRRSDYLAALQESKLDFAPIDNPNDWGGLLATPEFRERYEIGVADEPHATVIAWNAQRKPFDDKRVRLALTHALDRQRVIEDVLKGTARPVSGPFYPTMWGGDPTIAPWPFDLGRAAALLDEAGQRDKAGKRMSFELIVSEGARGPALDEILAIFRSDLGSIGVEMKIAYVPRNELVSRLILRNFDAALYSWNIDIPDPDPYVLVHSSQVAAGNYAGYASAQVDALVDAGRSTTDRAKRKEAYAQVHRLVHEDEPYTWLYSMQDHFAWSRRLRGVNPIDVGALPRWPGVARWWVER